MICFFPDRRMFIVCDKTNVLKLLLNMMPTSQWSLILSDWDKVYLNLVLYTQSKFWSTASPFQDITCLSLNPNPAEIPPVLELDH